MRTRHPHELMNADAEDARRVIELARTRFGEKLDGVAVN